MLSLCTPVLSPFPPPPTALLFVSQLIALICSTTLAKKIHVSASSPQYIILTPPTPSLANPQPPQQVFANSYPYPDQDPVVFSPLTMANIPVAQA